MSTGIEKEIIDIGAMEATNENVISRRKLLKTRIEQTKIMNVITMIIMIIFPKRNQKRKVKYLKQILNLVPRTIFLHLKVNNQIQMMK